MNLYAEHHCSRFHGEWKTRMGHKTCPYVYLGCKRKISVKSYLRPTKRYRINVWEAVRNKIGNSSQSQIVQSCAATNHMSA